LESINKREMNNTSDTPLLEKNSLASKMEEWNEEAEEMKKFYILCLTYQMLKWQNKRNKEILRQQKIFYVIVGIELYSDVCA
jgi:hypothetical protein